MSREDNERSKHNAYTAKKRNIYINWNVTIFLFKWNVFTAIMHVAWWYCYCCCGAVGMPVSLIIHFHCSNKNCMRENNENRTHGLYWHGSLVCRCRTESNVSCWFLLEFFKCESSIRRFSFDNEFLAQIQIADTFFSACFCYNSSSMNFASVFNLID